MATHADKNPPVSLKNALISVFDKRGLGELCQALKEFGVQIYSTGGTGDHIKKMGLPVHKIEDLTQFPEMMDGRVKTLHPKIFGGILARRDHTKDLEEAKRFEIPLFDLVVVNLYPFWEHLGETTEQQVPFIDIGGPSMIRASAKNHAAVAVLSDPDDYPEFVQEIRENKGATRLALRHQLAARTFRRTSRYDALIASQWEKSLLPTEVSLTPQRPLRYGENPHQKAAWCGQSDWKVLQGKELSYNNLLDAEAALRLVHEFKQPAASIIKHNNPCGVASFEGALSAVFAKALEADPKSAFGGIVAINRPMDDATARATSPVFLEVILAPSFTPGALAILGEKKNLRLIEWARPVFQPYELRASLGGWLLQDLDTAGVPADLKTVTKATIAPELWDDVKFAWLVCKHVRSNAIVLARGGSTLGIGAGQMSRVDSVSIALQKAVGPTQGAVLASDAFFPFRDNIDLLKGRGIAAIVQPGGSQRDNEVIQACDELGIAMVFTGTRHFRH